MLSLCKRPACWSRSLDLFAGRSSLPGCSGSARGCFCAGEAFSIFAKIRATACSTLACSAAALAAGPAAGAAAGAGGGGPGGPDAEAYVWPLGSAAANRGGGARAPGRGSSWARAGGGFGAAGSSTQPSAVRRIGGKPPLPPGAMHASAPSTALACSSAKHSNNITPRGRAAASAGGWCAAAGKLAPASQGARAAAVVSRSTGSGRTTS